MTQKSKIHLKLVVPIFSFLFFLFFVRLGLASLNKPFWQDETNAFCQPLRSTVWQMLLGITSGEASSSPLYYIVNRIWYGLFDFSPQRYIDLRLFGRVQHIFYWALACVSAGVFVYRFYFRHLSSLSPKLQNYFSIIVAVGATLFIHSNSFASYYAIEDRAYSAWVSLSLIHFLIVLSAVREPLSNKKWLLFFGVSIGMVMAAYTSLAQIGILAIVVYLFNKQNRKGKHLILSIILILVCSALGLFYYSQVSKMNYSPGWFTMANYISTLNEVLAKTFHLHSWKGTYLLLPILFFISGFQLRKNKLSAAISFTCVSMLFLTFIFYHGSQRSGGLWASRYVIFLVPYFTALYGVGLIWVCVKLERIIQRAPNFPNFAPGAILVLWASVQIMSVGGKYLHSIRSDIALFHSRNSFAFNPAPECAIRLMDSIETYQVCDHKGLEQLNDFCRGLSSNPLHESFRKN